MLYGQRGQGNGRMPGFGDNPNTEEEDDGMFTDGMIRAVAEYEASLGTDAADAPDEATTTTTTAGPTEATTTTTAAASSTTTQEP
jgi:hypothetical protein